MSGAKQTGAALQFSEDQIALFRTLAADGASLKAMGRALDCHMGTIKRAGKRYGIDLTVHQARREAGAKLLRERYAQPGPLADLLADYCVARAKKLAMWAMISHANTLGLRRGEAATKSGPQLEWLDRLRELVAEGYGIGQMAKMLGKRRPTVSRQVRELGLNLKQARTEAFAAADKVLRDHYATEIGKNELFALYAAARGHGATMGGMRKRATDMGLRRPVTVQGGGLARKAVEHARLVADAARLQEAFGAVKGITAALALAKVHPRRFGKMRKLGLVTVPTKPVAPKVAKPAKPRRVREKPPAKPASQRKLPETWVRAEPVQAAADAPPVPVVLAPPGPDGIIEVEYLTLRDWTVYRGWDWNGDVEKLNLRRRAINLPPVVVVQ